MRIKHDKNHMKNKYYSIFKTCLFICMCFVFAACLAACGKNNDWIFSIRENKLTEKDVSVFGLIYAKEYNIRDKELLNKNYEGNTTYGQRYKNQLEQDILETVLLYQEAEEKQCKLSAGEEESIKTYEEQFWNYYGDRLSETDIGRDDVEKAYRMKVLGQAYLSGLFDENEKGENYQRYIKVYQVTFPTVALDEAGMVVSGQDGKIVHIPDDEAAKKKAEAESFAEAVKEGGNFESLLKNYDNTVTGMEKYLPYDGLDKAYKNAVDSLKEGDVSQVIASDYGYYVIKLLEKEAAEYSNSLSQHEEGKQSEETKQEMLDDMYDKYIYGRNEYKNVEKWEKLSFDKFIK